MTIPFDDVRREPELTYFFLNGKMSARMKEHLDAAGGIDYACYPSSQFEEVLPAGMKLPAELRIRVPVREHSGMYVIVPFEDLWVIVSHMNTEDLHQKVLCIMRGSEEQQAAARRKAEELREEIRNGTLLQKIITKDSVIPVGKSDVELLDELLSSEPGNGEQEDDGILLDDGEEEC